MKAKNVVSKSIKRWLILLSLALTGVTVLALAPAPVAAASSCTAVHVVQHGETLSRIARFYGVPVNVIAQANNIWNPNRILAGQALCIPMLAPAPTPTCQSYYTINPGDTLARIGLRFGMSWTSIAAANNISNPNRIYAGQVICIPGIANPVPVPVTKPTFSILSVNRNQTVTIQAYNYPPNTVFDVRMGPFGSAAINGYYVTSFNSGQGGNFSLTFNIPPAMYNANRIAIRTDSSVGHFAYNWFWNN